MHREDSASEKSAGICCPHQPRGREGGREGGSERGRERGREGGGRERGRGRERRREGERERGREGGRERGREGGGRERGREGGGRERGRGRERRREGERKGGREGGRERGREGEREGGSEGGRERGNMHTMLMVRGVHLFDRTAISHGAIHQEAAGRRIEQLSEMLDGPHSLGRPKHGQLCTGGERGSQATDGLLGGTATLLEVQETGHEVDGGSRLEDPVRELAPAVNLLGKDWVNGETEPPSVY